ncbi:MAG: hypothetical protein JWP01_1195 [Myxococcales bacterium]|nr:hypothetical protein [Myxococcales bacterium]
MGRASSASSSDASVPGKRTLTEQLPAAEESDIVRRVAVRAGAKVTDRGNFGYVITAEGAFEIVSAPPQFAHTVGNTITMRGAFRTAWVTLATIALETPSSDSTSEQCTEPEDGMSMLPAPAPAPAPAPDEGMSIGAPSPSTGAPGAGGGEAVAGDLRWCSDNEAILRDETGAELVPRQLVPRKAHVRVLETRAWKRAQLAKVERVDASGASTLLGWTAVSNLHELQRPKRPSDPGKQMADLLQRSKGGGENGRCFAALKMYIRDIGGYGDILDIQTDERFEGYQESGYQFADAIRSLAPRRSGSRRSADYLRMRHPERSSSRAATRRPRRSARSTATSL